MKANNKNALKAILGVAMLISLAAASATAEAGTETSKNPSGGSRWNVQVDKVVLGSDVTLEPAFQVAVYEDMLEELAKTNRFDKVFRSGDQKASDAPDLLILKTTVLKYVPGSQTRRAVTTVSGATKITVRFQLCTRGGEVVTERVVNGNVRFFGTNLRATHNLARNIAKAIKQASLAAPPATTVASH